MRYRDRSGREYSREEKLEGFLEEAYSSRAGRALMKVLSGRTVSKCAGVLLDSKLSSAFIQDSADRKGVDLFDYEDKDYETYAEYFRRQIKPGRRAVDMDPAVIVSPCDGYASAYEITNSSVFVIKNSVYSVEALLRDKKLSARFGGGTAVIIRLTAGDLHRYIYPADGVKSHDREIKGYLNAIYPAADRNIPVYKENSRTYCLIRTKSFGDILQMEVGALAVGRIENETPDGGIRVYKGREKGHFEYGGSTVVLLLEKGRARVDEDLLRNTREGFETRLRRGERIAAGD